MWRCSWAGLIAVLESIAQDFRYGLRQMRRSPGFTAVAVLTLALGIGANIAIFTLVNSVVLRMLPVRDPQRLVLIQVTKKTGVSTTYSYPFYKDLRDHNEVLSGLLVRGAGTAYLGDDAASDPVQVERVSGNYFSVLGVEPALGRPLRPDDDPPAGDVPCVLGYGIWQRAFRGDKHIIGKSIHINSQSFTVVGVAPRAFAGSEPGRVREIFIPISMSVYLKTGSHVRPRIFDEPRMTWLEMIGRLKPGITREQARASLQLTINHIDEDRRMQGLWAGKVDLLPGGQGYANLRKLLGTPLLVLMAAVGLVLLIACANLANLLLARASARRRETAVRLALGATPARLARQLLTESLLLSLAGGLAGLLASAWVPRALLQFAPRKFTLEPNVSFDWRVLAFTFAVSVAVGLLFGLGPAINSARLDLNPTLKQTPPMRLARFPVRKLLVIAQVVLSLVLVMGAGLLIRSLRNLQTTFPGFDRENLLLVDLEHYPPPAFMAFFARPPERGEDLAFLDQVVERTQALPGVRSVSFGMVIPLSGDSAPLGFIPEGYERKPGDDMTIWNNMVAPNYFATMGIRLLAGRDFTARDRMAPVAIINETAARRFWPGRNPVGSHIMSEWGKDASSDKRATEIVGVVADTKYESLREAPRPVLYRPLPGGLATLHARVDGNVRPAMAALQSLLKSMGAPVPASGFTTLEAITADSLSVDRLMAALSASFGLLALLLAAVGLYGVMAYAVNQRTAEIGIRMAMGARQADVLSMVLRESLALVLAGVVPGVLGGLAAGRLISAFLFGLSWHDPAITACAVVVVLGVATLAAYLPARRAAAVDPLVALRYE